MNDLKRKWMTNYLTVCLLAMACCVLWGSAFPGIKTGYRLFRIFSGDLQDQILFAGCRFFLAGLLVIFIGSIAGKRLLKPSKGSWKRVWKLALFQTILQYLFFYVGLAHASGVKSSVIIGSNVFIAILLACLVFRQERLTWGKMVGCMLGLSGIVLVNLNGAGWGTHMSFLGEGFVFLSAVASALSSVMIKKDAQVDSPVMLSGYQFSCGGAVMIVIGLLGGGRFPHVTWQGIAILIYLAFLSAVAYTLWALLLKYNPVSRVAVWGFTNPIFGVLLSMAFLPGEQEVFGVQIAAALLLVSFGIYLVNRRGSFARSR